MDIDFASADCWDIFCVMYDCASLVYSTHKHTPEKPRLRLVILLDRDVTPEEYEAIGRRVAQSMGIEMFDDTTYQAERLMYWPSTAADGEFFFRFQDGPALSATMSWLHIGIGGTPPNGRCPTASIGISCRG